MYLPTEMARHDELVRYVKESMSEAFGGYTVYSGNGGWVDDDGRLIEEPVRVIESYSDDATAGTRMLGLATYVYDHTTEDAIMYTVGGDSRLFTGGTTNQAKTDK